MEVQSGVVLLERSRSELANPPPTLALGISLRTPLKKHLYGISKDSELAPSSWILNLILLSHYSCQRHGRKQQDSALPLGILGLST